LFDERKEHKSILAKLKFIFELKRKKFDAVFLLHRSFTRTLITYLAGIPERIGYFTKKRGFLLTKRISAPNRDKIHRLDYYVNLIESCGIEVEYRSCEIFIPESAQQYITNLLDANKISKNDFVVVMNPGGNWDLKRWAKENFCELADRLVSQFNAKIVITGAEKDISLTQEISNLMKTKPTIFSGKTTLKQLAALLRRTNLVISADSGPMHIANALGSKLVALFGPTSADITGPYNRKNCIVIQSNVGCEVPCYNLKCKENVCMKDIKPEMVLEKIKKEFLKNHAQR